MPGETRASFFLVKSGKPPSLADLFFARALKKNFTMHPGIAFATLGFACLLWSNRMRISGIFTKWKPYGTGLVLTVLLQLLTACGEESTGPSGDPDAQLVLLEPRGGETYHVGDSLRVRWMAQGKGLTEISSVALTLSPDSGQTWIYLLNGSIAPADGNWGAYGWEIPASLTAKGTTFALAGNVKILVRVQDYQNVSDVHKTAMVPKPIAVQP
jgi:hypothetical protein